MRIRDGRSLGGRRARNRRRLGAAAALAAVAVAAAGAHAGILDSDGAIHGCYQKHSGLLRVVDTATDACRASEVPISWSEGGPPGEPGPAGPGLTELEQVTLRKDSIWSTQGKHYLAFGEARCPNGKFALNGGWTYEGTVWTPAGATLSVSRDAPWSYVDGRPTSWAVVVRAATPFELIVFATCAAIG